MYKLFSLQEVGLPIKRSYLVPKPLFKGIFVILTITSVIQSSEMTLTHLIKGFLCSPELRIKDAVVV